METNIPLNFESRPYGSESRPYGSESRPYGSESRFVTVEEDNNKLYHINYEVVSTYPYKKNYPTYGDFLEKVECYKEPIKYIEFDRYGNDYKGNIDGIQPGEHKIKDLFGRYNIFRIAKNEVILYLQNYFLNQRFK